MKAHRLIIPVLIFGLLVLSCSKSSTPAVSPTQAQQTFGSVNTSLSSDIGGLNTAEGNVALNSFSGFSGVSGNPFGRIRSFNKPGDIKKAVSQGLASIRQMLLKGSASERVSGSTPFGFADKKGVYVYNFDQNQFVKSQTTSEIIKIDYPKDDASKANHTNNAELQISAYSEVSTPQGYQPTLVQAAIYLPIGGTKEVELKLTAGYDSNGDPNKGSVDLYINPYTISWTFDNSQPTSATETFSFSKSGKLLIGTGLTVLYASAADKTNGNPPRSATGYVQLVNVRFNIVADGSKGATSQSLNDFVTITVTVDGGVAGHVVWVADPQTGDEVAYIQYNDKTQAKLETVFADLKTQLDALGG